MKKVLLNIQETVKFDREVLITIPDQMNEDELNSILDSAQRSAESVDDIVRALRKLGIEQTEPYDTDFDSPSSSEVECEDYEFVEGEAS